MGVKKSNDIFGRKVYVVDSNVLMNNPYALYILSGNKIPNDKQYKEFRDTLRRRKQKWSQDPNDIVICDIVQRELDYIKTGKNFPSGYRELVELDIRSFLSRQAITELEFLFKNKELKDGNKEIADDKVETYRKKRSNGRSYGNLNKYVELENGAKVYISEHDESSFQKRKIPMPNNDDRIIHHLMDLKENRKNDEIILVSFDKGHRLKATQRGISNQEFEYENIANPRQLYEGVSYHQIDDFEELSDKILNLEELPVYSKKELSKKFGIDITPNHVLAFYRSTPKKPLKFYVLKEEKGEIRLKPVIAKEDFNNRILAHNNSVKLYRKQSPSNDFEEDELENIPRNEIKKYLYNCLAKAKKTSSKWKSEKKGDKKKLSKKIRNIRNSITKLNPNNKLNAKKILEDINRGTVNSQKNNQAIVKKTKTYFANQINLPFNEEIKPFKEQIAYFDLLTDEKIKILSSAGIAGTGKTYFALMAGLMQVMEGKYSCVKYIKPLAFAEKDLGFLPGELRKKLQPVIDAAQINYLEMFNGHNKGSGFEQMVLKTLGSLEEKGIIKYDMLAYQRGNTWTNEYVVLDEAQLTTRKLLRLSVGRVGRRSKLVVIGDLKQIDNEGRDVSYVTERNSGLSHMIEKFPNNKIYPYIYAHINLIHPKRSDVSSLADLI